VAGKVQTASIDWDTDERFVSLRRPLGLEAFGMNQITLKPRQRLRIHRHARQEEVYLVLRGRLTLLVEQEPLELPEGTLARVPSDVRRQLVNLGTEPCVVVALGGTGEHESRDGEAFTDWSEPEGRPPQEVPLPDDLPLP
jgi:quercetin dioxygenase-like cupin family protein